MVISSPSLSQVPSPSKLSSAMLISESASVSLEVLATEVPNQLDDNLAPMFDRLKP